MTDTNFSNSISIIYDNYMVPLIFEPYAEDLAKRVAESSPNSILEIAAGTGVVTKNIVEKLKPSAHFTVTDLNQPMLDVAKQKIHDTRITWRQCDALAMPFKDQEFDAVVCQFGAMFFPDRVQGYKEVRRVLKPHGRFYLNVWDKISENYFAEQVEDLLGKYFSNDPPKFMSRTPHGYFDQKAIRDDLAAAEFSKIEIETVSFVSHAPSAKFIATAYCTGTPIRSEIESRSPNSLAKVTAFVESELTQRLGSGPIDGKIQALVIRAQT